MGDDWRDRDRRQRNSQTGHSSGNGHSSHRVSGSSHDSRSRDYGRGSDNNYGSRRDDRDRRSSHHSHRHGSPTRDTDSSRRHHSRERDGRDRKRDRGQTFETEERDTMRRDRTERESRRDSESDRLSGEHRSRGSSPTKRLRNASPPPDSVHREGRARAVDYVPSAGDIFGEHDVKPWIHDLDPELSPPPQRVEVTERDRKPCRLEAEGRLEPRRTSIGDRKMGVEERRGPRVPQKYEPRDRFDNVRSRAPDLNSKLGVSGCPVDLIANFFPMVTKPTWCLYNYRVSYSPEEEVTAIKKRLLRVHNAIVGANIFDGSNMYTIQRLDPEPMILFSERESDKAKIQLTITLTTQIPPGDVQYLQFYNIIIRACMSALKFEEMGRNFYDRHSAIKIPHHYLELWPGYVTVLRNYEDNLMLCVEVTHKVLRLETCLSIIYAHQRDRDSQEKAAEVLVGSIVMTHYNRKTYRVDDIDWTKNPLCSFEFKGKTISLADYYRAKYDIQIRDLNQPLLVSKPKRRDIHRAESGPILLIPELCQMTGLSEDIRRNYKVMRELATHLQQAPDRRVENIQNFMRRLRCCTDVREMIAKWGLEFEGRLVPVRGRIAPAEQVLFRTGVEPDPVKVGPNADWTFAFKSKNMYSSMSLIRWAIVVTQRDSRGVDNLLSAMRMVGKSLDFEVAEPQTLLRLSDNKLPTFVNAVKQVMADHRHVDLIFIILPNQQLELYSAVKKRCSLDYGVASQCFLSKHLQPNAKGLMSIVTKVVVQINAKLGGEPWATHNPLKASHTMILGFDVYHCGKHKGPSVGAMVATTNRDLSRYYSTVSFHSCREELSETLCADLTKCIHAFRSKNKDELPDRIIMYRDGVGEGQLSYVYDTELVQMRTALNSLYKSVGRPPPKFTLIICTKKGHARIFHKSGAGIRNPGAGTVVDNTITLPERYDFFLISQASTQGTVSPTTYNVLYDEQGLDPDKIQRLTFKLCHLYYNWSGTVAVPAVCQYAHKLAYLTGLSLGSQAHERLAHYLYFL